MDMSAGALPLCYNGPPTPYRPSTAEGAAGSELAIDVAPITNGICSALSQLAGYAGSLALGKKEKETQVNQGALVTRGISGVTLAEAAEIYMM